MARLEYYVDGQGYYRWRVVSSANGKIIGASSEGFSSKQNAVDNARLLGKLLVQLA